MVVVWSLDTISFSPRKNGIQLAFVLFALIHGRKRIRAYLYRYVKPFYLGCGFYLQRPILLKNKMASLGR